MSKTLSLRSEKLSCMALQRSSTISERSSSCSAAFLCRVTWLLEDEEMIVLKLWSCSSTSISLERGLEGTLADLRWQAMAIVGFGVLYLFSVNGKEENAAMVSTHCLYI